MDDETNEPMKFSTSPVVAQGARKNRTPGSQTRCNTLISRMARRLLLREQVACRFMTRANIQIQGYRRLATSLTRDVEPTKASEISQLKTLEHAHPAS